MLVLSLQSGLYRLLPYYGTTLPLTRAIICHCQAQNDTSGVFYKSTILLFTLHSSPNRLKPRYTLGLREVKSGAQLFTLFTTLHLRIAH